MKIGVLNKACHGERIFHRGGESRLCNAHAKVGPSNV
jgi:hypothetical protein